MVRKIIHVTGGRGSGKSTTAARLLREEYPHAQVIEEHEFGLGKYDREIGRQRFLPRLMPRDEPYVRERLRGVATVIVVGDQLGRLPAETRAGAEVIEIRATDEFDRNSAIFARN